MIINKKLVKYIPMIISVCLYFYLVFTIYMNIYSNLRLVLQVIPAGMLSLLIGNNNIMVYPSGGMIAFTFLGLHIFYICLILLLTVIPVFIDINKKD
jgi:hypothetical protein